MKKIFFVFMIVSFLTVTNVWSAEGLIVLKSTFSPAKTMNRFEAVVKQKGLNFFARINHAAGATKIGEKLRPTELLIFGNPQGGTPFMQCGQTVGIDLPLKVLVWEDTDSQVWLGYNDPAYLAHRHGIAQCPAAMKLANALQKLTVAALTE